VLGKRALLVIDGAAPKVLSPGQEHQGVRLISVRGQMATVEVQGMRYTLRVGEAPVAIGSIPADDGKRVVLTANGQGHFVADGLINGRTARFLVDTGATSIVLGEEDARRLGLPLDGGQAVHVRTANGTAMGRQIRLHAVRLGDVQVHDVPAIVLPMPLPYVLLGNSFLARFQMRRHNDQLTLERRF
jgi:aspartyl protease family protein